MCVCGCVCMYVYVYIYIANRSTTGRIREHKYTEGLVAAMLLPGTWDEIRKARSATLTLARAVPSKGARLARPDECVRWS